MTLRPLFSFYGSKWRDTPRNYPVPSHETIIEPFAGSAGYSLRYPHHNVILCDIDPIIAGLWSYLIKASTEDILSLPDLDDGQSVDELTVCQEARWLIGFWLNKAASSPRKNPSSWMRSGVRPGSFWGPAVRSRIAYGVELIRHWQVYNLPFEETPFFDRATWFIDPPYAEAGKHYRFGSSQVDYAALAAWTRDRLGQVIVCENQGASWLPFRPLADVKTTRAKRSDEAIWTQESVA